MIDLFSECSIKVFKNNSASFTSITIEFIVSTAIILSGILINYTFLKKLEKEKRSKAAGRKGNVIEPIMTGCCWVQMVFWPTRLAIAWIFHNEILKLEMMPIWMRYFMLDILMIGRVYLCFYSFFCAFMRYIYIVHYERVYHWDFEVVARRMKIASILIPCFVGTLSLFAVGGFQFQGNDIFDLCSDSLIEQTNGDAGISLLASMFPNFFTKLVIRIIHYFIVFVWLIFGVNIVEAFMYRAAFAWIGRYIKNFLIR